MVLEVRANRGGFHGRVDACSGKHFAIPDPGELEDLRRLHDARAENDFAGSFGFVGSTRDDELRTSR